jgi:uncharacterized membrane protein YfcA
MAWAALVAGSLFGGFIQPITGFGSAMIMVLFLSPALSMTLAPSVTAGVCCVLSSVMLWRLRRSVDWRGAFLPVAVYTAVNIAVIRMLDAFDLRLLTIIFGAFLVVLRISISRQSEIRSCQKTNTSFEERTTSSICAKSAS